MGLQIWVRNMSHICHLFLHYELNWYGSLNALLANKTFYMGHIYDFFTIINWINVGPFGNAFPHEQHLWSFWPLCTELMGIFKHPAWEKFPGEQHCKNPMFIVSWISRCMSEWHQMSSDNSKCTYLMMELIKYWS